MPQSSSASSAADSAINNAGAGITINRPNVVGWIVVGVVVIFGLLVWLKKKK